MHVWHAEVLEDLICEEHSMHELVERSDLCEELVIDFTALRREDADEAGPSLDLRKSLSQDFLMLEDGQFLQTVNVILEFGAPQLLYHLNQLQVGHLSEVLVAVARSDVISLPESFRSKRCKYPTCMEVLEIFQWIEEIHSSTFTSILVAFHSVLGFVRAFDLPVKLLNPDEIECICKEFAFDLHVEL